MDVGLHTTATHAQRHTEVGVHTGGGAGYRQLEAHSLPFTNLQDFDLLDRDAEFERDGLRDLRVHSLADLAAAVAHPHYTQQRGQKKNTKAKSRCCGKDAARIEQKTTMLQLRSRSSSNVMNGGKTNGCGEL